MSLEKRTWYRIGEGARQPSPGEEERDQRRSRREGESGPTFDESDGGFGVDAGAVGGLSTWAEVVVVGASSEGGG